jgi:hypothetical protein
MHINDSTNHQGDTPKEKTTQPCHRRPNRRPALGFPPVLEAGKSEQRQDNASKEVTAPAGVAVVRITMGFRPGPAVNPNAMGHTEKSHLWTHRRREASRRCRRGEGELTTVPPRSTETWAGRRESSRRQPAPPRRPRLALTAQHSTKPCRREPRPPPPGASPPAGNPPRPRRRAEHVVEATAPLPAELR